MCRSMVDIRSTAAEIRRGKKKKERNYRAKIYMVSLLHRATINHLPNLIENCKHLRRSRLAGWTVQQGQSNMTTFADKHFDCGQKEGTSSTGNSFEQIHVKHT